MENPTQNQVACITLDLKKRRFRIPGKTFKIIQSPEYFRLLVNPNSMGLVIEECTENARGAYQLSKVPTHRGCYEMTSKSLITEIVSCAGIIDTKTLHLEGRQIRGQNAIFFHIDPNPLNDTGSEG